MIKPFAIVLFLLSACAPRIVDPSIAPLVDGGAVDSIADGSLPMTAIPLIFDIGQSNSVGEGIYANPNGTLAADQMERRWTPFPSVTLLSKYAQSTSSPIPFVTYGPTSLSPYDAPTVVNMGTELSLARDLYNFAGAPLGSRWIKYAVSGSGLAANWLNPAYPTGGPPLLTQLKTFISDQLAAIPGSYVAAIVIDQGETDAIVMANALNWEANLTTLIQGELWPLFGHFFTVIRRLGNNQSVSGDNAIATVQAQQDSYVAHNPTTSAIVNTDNLYCPGGLHWAPTSYETIGDTLALALLDQLAPIIPDPSGPPRFVGGDVGLIWTGRQVANYVNPRWWAFAQDDDIALLVTWTVKTAGTGSAISLTTPAGFAQVGPTLSSTNGTDTAWLRVYWARKSGLMTPPVLNYPNQPYNFARIFIIRGALQTGDPFDVVSSAANNARSAALSIPGAVTTTDGDLVVAIALGDSAAAQTISGWTNPDLDGFAQIQQGAYYVLAPSIPNHESVAIATGTKTIAGAYGPTTALYDQPDTLQGAMTFAIKPRLADLAIAADPGTIQVDGQPVAFEIGNAHTISAEPGTISLAGQDALLVFGRQLIADAGVVDITAAPIRVVIDALIKATPLRSYPIVSDSFILRDPKP